MSRAIFLDRDGVLIEDAHRLTDASQIELLADVPTALSDLKRAGFLLVVVTNQSVVGRGLATERDVQAVHRGLTKRIVENGGPALDQFYYCPHHISAKIARYRVRCNCRKPASGMLLQAAREHDLDLKRSVMIGDRMIDVIAGASVRCQTIQISGPMSNPGHDNSALDSSGIARPDYICTSLKSASELIIRQLS